MKIAILSPFYPYRGGIAQFSGMLYAGLVREGCEVRAFNFRRLYPGLLFPGKTQYVEESDPAQAIESERLLDSINPLTYAATVRAIRRFGPDVLVISYWMSFFVPGYAHVANRLRGRCKVVTLLHNAIPHEPRFFDKPLARLLFRQTDGFVALSGNVARELEELRPGARCLVHPHPLYNQFGPRMDRDAACRRLGIDTSKKNLLFFGLIRDYKGLDLLIDALAGLDESYRLVIAGEAYGDFTKYRMQIDASPARERIHVFDRYIADAEVPAFFSSADALVLPYRSATQSGVVSVAYHYDLPMLATPVGDFAESIGRPQTGVVASAITPHAIATGLAELFTPATRAAIARHIQEEKAHLSWEHFCGAFLSFVKGL